MSTNEVVSNNMTIEDCKKEIDKLMIERKQIDNKITNLRQNITIMEMSSSYR